MGENEEIEHLMEHWEYRFSPLDRPTFEEWIKGDQAKIILDRFRKEKQTGGCNG